MWKILIYSRFEDIFADGMGCLVIMFENYEDALDAVNHLTSWGFVVTFGKE